MLPQVVKLHDIEDAEAFVIATIRRSSIRVGRQEYEELVCEGLLVLCEMADRFIVRMDGYDQDGKFSGYAARYLPNKLGNAWHRMHPEHLLKKQPDGSRKYEYLDLPVSWESAKERNYAHSDDDGGVRVLGDFVSS